MTDAHGNGKRINLARLLAGNLTDVFCVPRADAERYANGLVRSISQELEDGAEIDYSQARFPTRVIRL